MRTIRNFLAVMLTGLAFAAFQADAGAQTRSGESRSSRTTRSTGSSNVNRSTSRSSSSRSSVQQPAPSRSSVQSGRTSSYGGQSVTRPSAPARQVRPSVSAQENRPQSGVTTERRPSTTVRHSGTVARQPRPDQTPSRTPSQRPAPRPEQRPGSNSYRPDRNSPPPAPVHHAHRHDGPRIHPVHRDFIAYDRPSCFWTPHYHYFGHRVRVLPSRAVIHTHFGITYYCYNDVWYRPHGGYYVVCRPPFGTILAANVIADMAWAAVRFSYYNTVAETFRQVNENNRYIAEQNAIIAQNNATIAAQNNTIAMNQQLASKAGTIANELGLIQSYAAADGEYFYQDGVFYTKSANGEYSVIIPPAGAMVDTLPEDYEMVTLGGDEYYKVDDTVYKVTLSEGKPYFEVMGQLYS